MTDSPIDPLAALAGETPETIAPDRGPGLPTLPYAPIHCPPYRESAPESGSGTEPAAADGAADAWRFSKFMLPVCPGYFGGPRPLVHPCFALSRGGVSWMSLTPMEIESMLPGIEAARGKVVVGGMGLALAGFAIAMKETVERVTIVDIDAAVIQMATAFSGLDAWPCREKVEIVHRDLRGHRDAEADFLFVDIWPNYRMDCMRPQMQAVHRAIPAPACFYWGQEIDAVDDARARGLPPEAFDAAAFDAYREATGLPLVGLETPSYPALCQLAAANPAIGQARRP